MTKLDKNEIERYSRHILVKEVGVEGQKKLKSAKVLIIGMGGLGNPSSQYLVASGVGNLGLVDFDEVSLSNLQRQTLFSDEDIGRSKVEVSKNRLKKINPLVSISAYHLKLDPKTAADIIAQYDIILDCTDNFLARYLINDICSVLQKPLVHGSIYQFDGQASLFCKKDGPCYRCLYPNVPKGDALPNCNAAGVLGVLPGIIGLIQATETIKHILSIGKTLSGYLLCYDALDMSSKKFKIQKRSDCKVCGDHPMSLDAVISMHSGDLKESADKKVSDDEKSFEQVSPLDLKKDRKKYFLVDVREENERQIVSLDYDLFLPLSHIENKPVGSLNLPIDKPIVVYCKSGYRSKKAIKLLSSHFDSIIFHELKGGIVEYILKCDPSLPLY